MYELIWKGKEIAKEKANIPTETEFKVLEDYQSKNMLIAGDNLDVLKHLNQTHDGAFKLIYIDPPYNKGGNYIYDDGFTSHDHWLNMMYPRLQLAKNLLRDDGVICISVDQNEAYHVVILCNEIFGERNRVTDLIWKKKGGAKGIPPRNFVTVNHEFIICFAKDASKFKFKGELRDITDFKNPDLDPRGPWRSENMRTNVIGRKKTKITDPSTGKVYEDTWAFSQKRIKEMQKDNRLLFGRTVSQKKFLSDYKNPNKPICSILKSEDVGFTTTGAYDLKKLFGTRDIMSYPKPVRLMSWIVQQCTDEGDLVLDFFAGSGSTAQGCFNASATDGKDRNWVMVQLPLRLDPKDATHNKAREFLQGIGKPEELIEITKERIIRAGKHERASVIGRSMLTKFNYCKVV